MASWIIDGSAGFAVNGNVVTYVDNEGVDNVFNALWEDGDDGVSSGQHYWKIYFPTLENGAGVGLTSKDYFKKGYACKAINYLGNLSNCGALLVGNFGPRPKQGDTIGILAVFDSDRLKVYIDMNGESLGLAFDVPSSTFKSIYPIVSFHSSGSATCTKQMDIPNITDRAPSTFTGIEGNWKLTKFEKDNAPFDHTRGASAKITKVDGDKYSLSARVVNRMWTELSKVDGNWKTSGVCTTLMGSDPASMKFENIVAALIENVKVIEVDGSETLSIRSETMSTTWTRFDSTPGPFVGEPFA